LQAESSGDWDSLRALAEIIWFSAHCAWTTCSRSH